MNLIAPFLRIQNQLRIFHWQTESYAQHKAFGKAYEDLDDLIDQFVEVYMGKHGRTRAKVSYNIILDNLSDNYLEVVDSYVDYLRELDDQLDATHDSELLNIRDEMLSSLDRLKYLLTLK